METEQQRLEQVTNADGTIDYEKMRRLEKGGIKSLKALDHSDSAGVLKNFYKEHAEISKLTDE